jgi:hypothetical protein
MDCDGLRRKAVPFRRPTGIAPDVRRPSRRREPACEPLDDRQLLSTVVALPMPSPSVAANAAAALEAADPRGFAKFQRDLAQAESRSHVTQAQVEALAQDEAAIDQAIIVPGLKPIVAATTASTYRSFLDYAFRALPAHVATERLYLFVYSSDGQPRPIKPKNDPSIVKNIQPMLDRTLAQVPDGQQLVQNTIDQMRAIAQAVDLTPRLHAALSNDAKTLSNNARPGNFAIYFDSQVMNFVH